ncbi:MAG TPA: hypothetical protein VJ783_31335 [Pirellulales bacterium]|nr:hypothetical protein [Pirellulales bacterium]
MQTKQHRKSPRPLAPSQRDCRIYERHVLQGETQDKIAADYHLTRQRVAQIAGNVEGWIAAHPEHPLAKSIRVRCTRRWEALWAETMAGFERSRENREVTVERTSRAQATSGLRQPQVTVVQERTIRQHPGDVRFLQVALRVADRQQRLWPKADATALEPRNATGGIPYRTGGAAVRFPFLPAGLCDLADLACSIASDPDKNLAREFETRCAEAFRCLGFTVQQLGQGCGRVADCLALAPADRFGVILDAKVRRDGYTLGTDDRQFCEYAARHSRELAQSGIDRVYFAVIGSGFRPYDLENLAELMAAEPIRSVSFVEAQALMRLVNDSIAQRDHFRLVDIDRLLFGNKIIDE